MSSIGEVLFLKDVFMFSAIVCLSLCIGVEDAEDSTGVPQYGFSLRELDLALRVYADREGVLPFNRYMGKDDKGNVRGLSWRVEILNQYDDYGALYKKFRLDESWDSPHNKALIEEMPCFYGIPPGWTITRGRLPCWA